jgi:glycosyltransferase involved in cell wall biosynthesis
LPFPLSTRKKASKASSNDRWRPGDYIYKNSPVTDVEITVISDGSTDRTVEIASRYLGQISLIEFPQNKGYGAAIKEAWRRSEADFLGFLDADGTCDPKFFAPLCSRLVDQGADVVLGCRLNEHSRMPLLRRIGNFIFASILTTFSSSRVRTQPAACAWSGVRP